MFIPLWTRATLLGIILITVAFVGCLGDDADDKETEYTVTAVIDGDTVELNDGEQVRLLGLNAPETGEPWAANATVYLTSLVLNQEVTLKADVDDKDRYGRLLRHIFLVANKTHVNLALIEAGWAHTLFSESNYLYQATMEAAEARARAAELGIWAQSPHEASIEFMDLTEATKQESFTIKNKSNASVSLSGWNVKDAVYHTYVFYDLSLPDGASLIVYTGEGTDNTTGNDTLEVYWGQDLSNYVNYIWNNDGDRLFLRDEEGLLVLDYRYGDMAWPPP